MLRRCVRLCAVYERGMYFPFHTRLVDERESAQSHDECAVHWRSRRHLRSAFVTGETRQTVTPPWSGRRRPTHFFSLALPERNALVGRVRALHESILFATPQMSALLVPLSRLHVTLGVMTLPRREHHGDGDDDADGDDDDDDAACIDALRACVQTACRDVCAQPLQLHFRGLGTFAHGRVLFARCVAERHYTTLDTLVRRLRVDAGAGLHIDMKGNPHDSYVPHMTVAKVRPRHVATHGERVPLTAWAPHQHTDFGDVTFTRLDLCRMRPVRRTTTTTAPAAAPAAVAADASGYYPIVFSLDLVNGDIVDARGDGDGGGGGGARRAQGQVVRSSASL